MEKLQKLALKIGIGLVVLFLIYKVFFEGSTFGPILNGNIVLFIFIALFYFVPALIGYKKNNGTAIFWVNLLLGSTVLGWIGALIWSLASPLNENYMPFKYQCSKCELIKGFEQSLKMMKCPQCGKDNYYE